MKRSKHNLSYYKLLSMDMGKMVPAACFEVLPGDTIQMATSALVRLSPLIAPVMHPVHISIHHWFVPNRLSWDNWETFITGGPTGNDTHTVPTITLPTGSSVNSLGDYLGVPPTGASTTVSALPYRGYARIWNEWYRDQDLQSELVVSTADGPDTTTNTTLQNVNWEKDYFTSSRPWEQKGPAVKVPIGTTAPVMGLGLTGSPSVSSNVAVRQTQGNATYPFAVALADATKHMQVDSATASTTKPSVYADLSNTTGVTISQLREALAIQRFEEMRARYGSRYTEYLRALGVKSSDARLQRPEYLGGGKQTVSFSEILQTANDPSPGTGKVGDLKGHGIAAIRSNRFRRFFEEHGYVFSFIFVRPRTIYTQGLNKHWNKRVKEDFWQKELQFIGQAEILNKEIYAAHATPDGVFGYQDRYDEYRRLESSVAGEFRTSLLDFWHMARTFSSAPALNSTFVSCVPTERSFAVPSQDVCYIMANHSIQARRIIAPIGASATF